jgi:hypothetical protein
MAFDAWDAQPVSAYLFLDITEDFMGYDPSGFAAIGGNFAEAFVLNLSQSETR